MSYCNECDKLFKSHYSISNICKHINTKKHQKNKLINDNKCYNTLLALVRNNVDNNLIDNINKKVIQNYSKKPSNKYYIYYDKDTNTKIKIGNFWYNYY